MNKCECGHFDIQHYKEKDACKTTTGLQDIGDRLFGNKCECKKFKLIKYPENIICECRHDQRSHQTNLSHQKCWRLFCGCEEFKPKKREDERRCLNCNHYSDQHFHGKYDCITGFEYPKKCDCQEFKRYGTH